MPNCHGHTKISHPSHMHLPPRTRIPTCSPFPHQFAMKIECPSHIQPASDHVSQPHVTHLSISMPNWHGSMKISHPSHIHLPPKTRIPTTCTLLVHFFTKLRKISRTCCVQPQDPYLYQCVHSFPTSHD